MAKTKRPKTKVSEIRPIAHRSKAEVNNVTAEARTIVNVGILCKMLSRGKSQQTVREFAQKTYGISESRAKEYVRAAYKLLVPREEDFDDYRRGMIQTNINRLERIIEKCIDGNFQEKKVARECISELNKMFGVGGGNNVTIAKNNDGQEIINITFDK